MTISRLDQALAEIAPDERRVLERVAEPSLESNRWFKVMQNAEVGPANLFRWINRPDVSELPAAQHHYCEYKSVRSIATPIIELTGRPENHLDYYVAGESFFLSKRLLQVFRDIDPEAIEWVDADVRGTSQPYFYCLCTRSLKAVDEKTTTLILGPGRVVAFEDNNFAIANELVASNTHCFVLFHYAKTLWSRELVDAAVASGARGLIFWPPFLSPLTPQTIRI